MDTFIAIAFSTGWPTHTHRARRLTDAEKEHYTAESQEFMMIAVEDKQLSLD